MQTRHILRTSLTFIAGACIALAAPLAAVAQAVSPPPFPPGLSYYSEAHPWWPPLPGVPDRYSGVLIDYLGDGRYLLHDRGMTVSGGTAGGATAMDAVSIDPTTAGGGDDSGGSSGSGGTPDPGLLYGPGQLWLSIETNGLSQAFVTLHGPCSNWVQVLFKGSLTDPYWIPGQFTNVNGYGTVTNVPFVPVCMTNPLSAFYQPGIPNNGIYPTNPGAAFFRAAIGETRVTVTPGSDVQRPGANYPSGRVGFFLVNRENINNNKPDLTVYYRLGGTAVNGTDYYGPATNSILIPSGDAYATLYFTNALADTNSFPAFDKDIILSAIPNDSYLVDPVNGSATIYVDDDISTNSSLLQLSNQVYSPVGLAYSSYADALIVSSGAAASGLNVTFVETEANDATNAWSGLSIPYANLDEVNQTIVQATAAGFTNGDMYFGNGTNGGIGWLSADGTRSNLNWISLSNENSTILSLWVDQTGVFSNNLIAVSGNGVTGTGGDVWMIDAAKNARLLASINLNGYGVSLEGLITIPNNTNFYGPFAGKILTGSEFPPMLWTVDVNGGTNAYDFGIQPEDFNIVLTNQAFYVNNASLYDNMTYKLPWSSLTNYVGALIVTQEGLGDGFLPELFVLQWNTNSWNFDVRRIMSPDGNAALEAGTSAPLDIPAIFRTNPDY